MTRFAHRDTYCTRPWAIGRESFAALVGFGLKPFHRVLDFGCGPGRLGVYLVGYLDRGCYTGLDISADALRAFRDCEIPEAGLDAKAPEFSSNLGALAGPYDAIVDHYASYHDRDKAPIWCDFRRILAPGGRVYQAPPMMDGRAGFSLAERRRVAHQSLEGTEFQPWTEWGVYA